MCFIAGWKNAIIAVSSSSFAGTTETVPAMSVCSIRTTWIFQVQSYGCATLFRMASFRYVLRNDRSFINVIFVLFGSIDYMMTFIDGMNNMRNNKMLLLIHIHPLSNINFLWAEQSFRLSCCTIDIYMIWFCLMQEVRSSFLCLMSIVLPVIGWLERNHNFLMVKSSALLIWFGHDI